MNEEMQLSPEEMQVIHSALGVYMTISNLEVIQHKMYKEESMDRLFEKMENYATAGVAWVKIARAMGVPHERIAEFLQEADN